MTTKSLSNLAVAAVLAATAFAVQGNALANEWTDAIGVSQKVIGAPQTADRSTDWTKAVSAEEKVTGLPQIADRGPYGFFGQALAHGLDGRGTSDRRASQLAVN